MEANIPSNQGSSQGNSSSEGCRQNSCCNGHQATLPQSPNTRGESRMQGYPASASHIHQVKEEEQDEDVTMKVAPVKPTIIRKHSKQLSHHKLLPQGKSSPVEAAADSKVATSAKEALGIDATDSSLVDLLEFDPFSDIDKGDVMMMEADVEMLERSISPFSAASLSASTSLQATSSSSNAVVALCSFLPDDLICKVTTFLDVRSLLHVRECSRRLYDLASRNEAGWENLCRQLWADKIHVPRTLPFDNSATSMDDSNDTNATLSPNFFIEAYPASIRDARDRQYLTLEELCYDPEHHTGTIWSFRFKESAGADWTTTDPWHNGLPCRKMVFLKDGSVRQYIPADRVSIGSSSNRSSSTSTSSAATIGNSMTSSQGGGGAAEVSDSENSLPELVSPNFGTLLPGTMQQGQTNSNGNNNPHHPPQPNNNNVNNPGRLVQPPVSMSWRFVTRPMDLPERPTGSYIRFSVGGREVPTYSIRRSPTQNWGFVMESCWGLYASFEMPPKRSPAQQRQVAHRRRLRRTETGARWVEVLENGEETLASNNYATVGNLPPGQRGNYSTSAASSSAGTTTLLTTQQLDHSALMDDAALIITNEIQWREAFLYNVGSRTLPEGPEATSQFDRAFRGAP